MGSSVTATDLAAVSERVEAQPGTPAAPEKERRHHSLSHATIAVWFAVLLLVLATTSQGAFAISRWAPLTLFVLALLLGAVVTRTGAALPAAWPVRVALGAIWGLALWSLLSMLWAQSSASAFQGADTMILYAAIVTLPFALPMRRSALASVGWTVSAGIGLLAVYILVRLRVDGGSLFLAGRLNGPIDYRNATALLFAIPAWPFLVAAAAKTNGRPVRAAAFALAVLCLGLAFLTQSRGILIGLCLGGVVALAAGPDRVRRAWLALLATGGVAVASPWLLRPYHAFTANRPAAIQHGIVVAANALIVLTAAAFVVGMAAALFDQGLRPGSPKLIGIRRAARAALAAVIVIGLVAGAVAVGNPVTFARHKWDEFRALNASTTTASTRLLTVSGQRYDLWRVALKEFATAPIQGVGADNYSFGYYRDRETNRNLNDPHSLLFALLSELGIVGVVLFCAFIAGLVAAVRRGWSSLGDAQRRAVIAPAAGGAVLLGQSMVDWIWLIPGLTAIGLFLLAVAAAQATGPATRARTSRSSVLRIGAAGALIAAMLGLLALFLSDAYIQQARSAIYNPPAELSAARVASAFDPWAVDPHYLEASAYETMGERSDAYQQLRDALELEPANSATLGVIGDFEARGGDFAVARAYYRRALALNPLDVGLQQLSRLGETPARDARRHR